jgi:hypothetical protein
MADNFIIGFRFISTEKMQLDDPIRNIEIRVNELNSDPIVAKRNVMV